jgi:hypothetical protein
MDEYYMIIEIVRPFRGDDCCMEKSWIHHERDLVATGALKCLNEHKKANPESEFIVLKYFK